MDTGPPSFTSTFRHISHGYCRILRENNLGFHLRLPAPRFGHDFVIRLGFLLMNRRKYILDLPESCFVT